MKSINIAIVGIGNCASSLVQGLSHYRDGANDTVGLMHWDLGGYRPSDIHVVAAWDVDARKVGKDVADAIFAKPNCTAVFCEEHHEVDDEGGARMDRTLATLRRRVRRRRGERRR